MVGKPEARRFWATYDVANQAIKVKAKIKSKKLRPLKEFQKALAACHVDGWLLYNFRKSNPIATSLLSLPEHLTQSRRYFYFIPTLGSPSKLVHRIEQNTLDTLEGETFVYSSWREMEQELAQILRPHKKIAMEYSPKNAIPYISVVDAGTIELVRSLRIEIVSSADLVQRFKAKWTPEQLAGHLETSAILIETVHKAFDVIRTKIHQGNPCTEWDIQQFILSEFEANNLYCALPPNCSINYHSADPHYHPTPETALEIHGGDFVLIDLCAKKNTPESVYADYTWTGYVGQEVPGKYAEIFEIVKEARDRAVVFLADQLSAGQVVYGWQVDDVCRNYITDQGYGDFFLHRTGHSIGEEVHGWGANLDNLETKDERQLLPETCFSIEPGIYFPREFGIRSEINAYIRKDKTLLITGTPTQQEVIPILAPGSGY